MTKQWYIIHTYSGFEKKVKESLEGRVAAFGLGERIGRVIIPTEDVMEVRGGKKIVSPLGAIAATQAARLGGST